MKTSNKILIGVISFIGLSMLSVLIFAKASLINVEDNTVGGNGKIIKATYNIAEISLFKLRGKFDVFVTKGAPSLIIETDENIQAFLNPHDENFIYYDKDDKDADRELRIGMMDHVDLNPTQGIKVYLSTPNLRSITVSDHCKIVFEDTFDAEEFEVDVDDFAEVDMKLNTDRLNINMEDHGKLKIEGKIGETKIDASGFSEINLSSLEAPLTTIEAEDHAKISLIGQTQMLDISASNFVDIAAKGLVVAEAKINSKDQTNILLTVNDKLDVTAMDFASIRYLGSPEINKNIGKQTTLSSIE